MYRILRMWSYWGGGREISVGCNSHISTIVPTRPGLRWPQQWFMVEATCNNSCIITLWPIKRSPSSLRRHWPRIKPDLELDYRKKDFLPVLAGSVHAHAKDTVIIGKCLFSGPLISFLSDGREDADEDQPKQNHCSWIKTLDGGLIWDSWCWSSLRRITILYLEDCIALPGCAK